MVLGLILMILVSFSQLLQRAAETEAQRLDEAEEARDGFFVDGAGSDFDDLGQLHAVASDPRCGD